MHPMKENKGEGEGEAYNPPSRSAASLAPLDLPAIVCRSAHNSMETGLCGLETDF